LEDVVQNFLTYVLEKERVVDGWMTHSVVCAIVALVESKFLNLLVVWVPQPHLLAFHLNDGFAPFTDLLVIERTHSYCDFDAVSHGFLIPIITIIYQTEDMS
jgi:hypothetical protein